MFYFLFIGVFLLVLGLLFLIRKKNVLLERIIKVITICFIVLMFINILLPDGFTVSLSVEELVGNNYFEAIIRWFRYVSFLVIPICVFFDKTLFKRIAIYFCLPIAIINLVIYFMYLPDITNTTIRGIANIRFFSDSFKLFISNEMFRSIFFGLISLLELVILSYMLYKEYKYIKFNNIKEFIVFIMSLIGLILVIIPIYIPQYLIGYTDIIFTTYSLSHFLWIISLVVIYILLYFIFRKASYENKYILLLILSMSLFIQYNQMFSAINELTFKRMPLQLCNIGSYLILITLLTKSRRLYVFTLVVNVVGALIAISILGVDGLGIGYLWNMHYILEHSGVILIPLLCLSLKMFPKIEKTDIVYVLLGFTIYFILVLSIGVNLNYIYEITGNDFFSVNYLFMFDKDVAINMISISEKLFELKINIGIYTFYPLIQSTVYFTFISLCFGMFYLLYWLEDLKRGGEE